MPNAYVMGVKDLMTETSDPNTQNHAVVTGNDHESDINTSDWVKNIMLSYPLPRHKSAHFNR